MSAPRSPTALGRWNIQFCHALSRPNIFDSIVSGPGNRRLASMPTRASGRKARPLLDRDPHLVLPVDVIGGEGDDAKRLGGLRVEGASDRIPKGRR